MCMPARPHTKEIGQAEETYIRQIRRPRLWCRGERTCSEIRIWPRRLCSKDMPGGSEYGSSLGEDMPGEIGSPITSAGHARRIGTTAVYARTCPERSDHVSLATYMSQLAINRSIFCMSRLMLEATQLQRWCACMRRANTSAEYVRSEYHYGRGG